MKQHIDSQDRVAEFHKVFGLDIGVPLTAAGLRLRMTVIIEEMKEASEAGLSLLSQLEYAEKNGCGGIMYTALRQAVGEFRKEMTDLRYVIDGTYVAFGWDHMVDTNKVHQNNMTKLGPDGKPIYREDGKVLKPDTYKKLEPMDLVDKLNMVA